MEENNAASRRNGVVQFIIQLGAWDQDFQPVNSFFLLEVALAAVFFYGFFNVGNTKAMHKAVFLCGSLCQMVSRLCIVFYGDKQHIPDTLGLDSNQALVLRQIFAGLYRVVNGVAKDGTDVQRLHEVDPVKVNHSGKINLFSRAFAALSFRMMSRNSFPVCT